ncbi:glycoside hydrolase family 127 protein [Streptomyces sp. L7]|uniref:glycoside hydrolase family 127 protein n=1 Tax=Streptomyces sp. L7 TaxID=3423954 RepID=UPI003D963B32
MTDTSLNLDHGRPVAPTVGVLRPLGIQDVRIRGGFWGDRQELNHQAMIEHCEYWIERAGWVANFDAAREGRLPEARTGREFADSDVYKLLEAMAWEIGRTGDEAMDARFRAIVDRIAPVQEADGYLNTHFGRPGQAPRYTDLEWGHELYCYGHLIQAAIARGRTTGPDEFVEIARRAADHVCEAFGPDGIPGVCGHPEIEVALAELARYTGEAKYLEQARLFLERRGRRTLADIEFGRQYFQDDTPLRETEVMAGHAVRALYLAAGGVDVAVETGDSDLFGALQTQVANTTARRTYVTGGMGAHHEGESFGLDFELPPDRAYSETCAGVGSVMVNFRLLLATGESRYADAIERTLYNVVAGSPGVEGTSFFYTNTLYQRVPGATPAADAQSPRASSSLRAPWFDVSCCPTNVARTFSSMGAYVATTSADGLQLHQFVTGSIGGDVGDGHVTVSVETAYPDDGAVTVTVTETVDAEWELAVRVPGWAHEGATLVVDGEERAVVPGTARVRRRFAVGDTVQLRLDVSPRLTFADPRVDAVRGAQRWRRDRSCSAPSRSTSPKGRTSRDCASISATPRAFVAAGR